MASWVMRRKRAATGVRWWQWSTCGVEPGQRNQTQPTQLLHSGLSLWPQVEARVILTLVIASLIHKGTAVHTA
jgi:hypothetical protein